MAVFSYKALDLAGSVSQGEITANDRTEALGLLGKKGLQPVKLTATSSVGEKSKSKSSKVATKKTAKVSNSDTKLSLIHI